jgi:hypothetical protein
MMIVGSGQMGGVGPVIAASDGPVLRVRGMVRVAMEGTLEKEHEEETSQHPRSGIVDTPAAGPGGVGEEVEERDPEENPPGERQQHLHPPVAEAEERHRSSPRVGGNRRQDEADDKGPDVDAGDRKERDRRGNHGRTGDCGADKQP